MESLGRLGGGDARRYLGSWEEAGRRVRWGERSGYLVTCTVAERNVRLGSGRNARESSLEGCSGVSGLSQIPLALTPSH
jgi:hypothetical protein